jgi:hypothetical protein
MLDVIAICSIAMHDFRAIDSEHGRFDGCRYRPPLSPIFARQQLAPLFDDRQAEPETAKYPTELDSGRAITP